MPFTGATGRQILACGDDRIVIVEPSGRVAWKREKCPCLACVRICGNDIYWSDGSLKRVAFSMAHPGRTQAKILYKGPTDACDVRGFDFTSEGRIVAAAEKSRMIVELDGETFVPLVWIKTEKEPIGVRKTRNKTYLVVFADSVEEYDARGVKTAGWHAGGKPVCDALRLADGSTLVAASDEIRAYAADGSFKCALAAKDVEGTAGGAFSSLQHLSTGETVVGVKRAAKTNSPALAAFAVGRDGTVAWRIDSPADAGMFAVQKIQGREEYD